MSTVLTLGHSPDPDDAFMFYALAEHKIDTGRWRFEHILQDIQTLNERATRGELHISAISIHAYAHVLDKYALRLAIGECETIVVPFDEIFDAVKSGRADVGLIIHEGQLTYANEQLALILDLGVWWKIKTGLPLPLGGNVIRKDLAPADRREINAILAESIRYGLEHRAAGVAHAMPLARGMDTQLADKFIGMYVNDFTLDYGDTGRAAIREFLGRAHTAGLIPAPVELEFVE